jgi:hypothetical protein
MFNFDYMKNAISYFRRVLLIWLLSGILINVQAQQTLNYSLGKLLDERIISNSLMISSTNLLTDNITNSGCNLKSENVVLSKGILYLNPSGTGFIYAIDSTKNPKRLDATCFQGYNFGASFFSYHDTLYSIGGYGFWNYTGAIRYFDHVAKEWNIIKTEKDVPFANGINAISYFDNEKGQLYILYSDSNPEYLLNNKNSEKVKIQCFDLNSKKWLDNSLYLDPSIVNNISKIKTVITTNEGLIVNIDDLSHSIEIIFNEKKAYEVNDDFITHLIQEKSKLKNYISYYRKDTLLFYELNKDSIIKIYYRNNKKKEFGLFKKEFQLPNYIQVITILLFIILIFISYIIKVRIIKNKNKIIKNKTEKPNIDFKGFIDSLDYLESEALEIIISNSMNNNKTNVDELNKVLGTTKRHYKIQNNIRAEIIGLINKKFISAIGANDILIERNRTSFDKRFFEYEISPKYLKRLFASLK